MAENAVLGSSTGSTAGDKVYYDPYLREIVKNPYPVYRRLRQEAPLYYNEKYDFYAVSRYSDVQKCFLDHETFISGRGGILELIKENVQMPPGTFIFEDPPQHTVHRRIVQRIFAPKRMAALEEQIREMTKKHMAELAHRDEFDFIGDVGGQIPMRVIGMLLGIPEEDFQEVRRITDSKLVTEEGKPVDYSAGLNIEQDFERYVHWRRENPSDDVITELLNVEFTDENGVERKLSIEELTTFVNLLAGAGNETTNRLIGWMAKSLAENPDQRRELVANPALIPQAIEEALRLEPPPPHVGRYVAKDVVIQGQTVPAGSTILLLVGSANHDDEVFPDPEQFNMHRERPRHMTFGHGIHTCIGNVLARMEARVVFEELLKQIPDWDVDLELANLSSTSTVRGWETLPTYRNEAGKQKLRANAAAKVAAEAKAKAEAGSKAPASVEGKWTVTVKGPTGPMDSSLELATVNGALGGTQAGDGNVDPIDSITYNPANGEIEWINKIKKPMKLKLTFKGVVEGDTMTGKVKTGFMGAFPFTAVKA
ncbi:cytochrome P450 [Ketobacter sp.]|uniref:cytochrome P450 n=1 Tax=Ketobacter sp. TaxID=2083498 RepID=UPI0025BD178B|nr:cytochrome P450 [Ketobacter sp.]